MSSIKLTADTNGGTFELKAPSSSSNTRVLTLPDTANGTVLTTTNPKAGNIIQVVQYSTNNEVSSTSGSFVDSGLSGAITTTGSNKVIVIVNQYYRHIRSTQAAGGGFRVLRGSTVIETDPTNSNNLPFGQYLFISGVSEINIYGRYCNQVLDTPSAGTHTYKTQMALNSTGDSSQVRAQYQASGVNATSYLTLMEVAA
jgi:hypothetical protein